MDGAQAFHAARDVLLRHGTDLDAARAAFRWPALDRFNWALDHFDRMAAGNQQAALRFAAPGAPGSAISFAELAARSNQVANHLRSLGVARVEILKRGSAVDVEDLRRRLRLADNAPAGGGGATAEASLLLTRVAGTPVVVVAERVRG